MAKRPAVHTCAPPPLPSLLSIMWAFDHAHRMGLGARGFIARDEWPEFLHCMGAIAKPPLTEDSELRRHIRDLCYDLQERGWLPGSSRLYGLGIWNASAKAPRYEVFLRFWSEHAHCCVPFIHQIVARPMHFTPLPRYPNKGAKARVATRCKPGTFINFAPGRYPARKPSACAPGCQRD